MCQLALSLVSSLLSFFLLHNFTFHPFYAASYLSMAVAHVYPPFHFKSVKTHPGISRRFDDKNGNETLFNCRLLAQICDVKICRSYLLGCVRSSTLNISCCTAFVFVYLWQTPQLDLWFPHSQCFFLSPFFSSLNDCLSSLTRTGIP